MMGLPHIPPARPVADGMPLMGSAGPLMRDPLRFFLEQYLDKGPVYEVHAAGRSYVILAGPEANAFFRRHASTHFDGAPIYAPYAQDIGSDHVLVGMEGDAHQALRKSLQPAFAMKALESRFPSMLAQLRSDVAALGADVPFPVRHTLGSWAAQAAGITMTGCPFHGSMRKLSRFAHIFLGAGVGGFPEFMRHLPSYRRARRAGLAFLRKHLLHAEGGASAPLVKALRQHRKTDGQGLSERDLLANLHMPYTNSFVYVGALAGFLLHFLLRHPAALAQFRSRYVQLAGSGRTPDARALLADPFLSACLQETQRLQPISLSAPRVAARDFVFQGHVIRKGEALLIATAVTHYLPEFHTDPEQWKPERFVETGAGTSGKANWSGPVGTPPEAFVPFGLDGHRCIAAPLVRLLTLTMVGELLSAGELTDTRTGDVPLKVAPFPTVDAQWKVHFQRHHSGNAAPIGT